MVGFSIVHEYLVKPFVLKLILEELTLLGIVCIHFSLPRDFENLLLEILMWIFLGVVSLGSLGFL